MAQGILRRYGEHLPITDRTPDLSLCEGSTPLIPLINLGRELSVELYAKFDGLNPTGSFKDRGMVLAVAKALEEEARSVVCASTGNTSASAAAYAARAGIPCFVVLPAGNVAMGKLAQAIAYGAKVVPIEDNFDVALDLARKGAEEMGMAIVNSVNPYRLMGQRSASWEICDELGDRPDWLVLPVGNAGNISAYREGFDYYSSLGRCSGLPRMVGVQASGSAPLALGREFPEPETVATAIRIGRPVNAEKAKKAVSDSGGTFLAVDDDEILKAQRLLAGRDGLFAEPASCAGVAGLMKLKEQGELPEGIRIVTVLTGNGLKDPDALLSRISPIEPVKAQWSVLEEIFGS
ncbi:threonine synthase [Dethiosulfovibrio sp. F2B]|uniref:threonine synthase n=1 Tax=Dethiosulfovibrio faecalis TaxID=2720018 RepID=UPI001F37E4C5|nr:threonine synthase [Dethiosulfovibrio faecalis]MCF4150275.1 threonine synthase [Dethiosulfovibrio faecalis]